MCNKLSYHRKQRISPVIINICKEVKALCSFQVLMCAIL